MVVASYQGCLKSSWCGCKDSLVYFAFGQSQVLFTEGVSGSSLKLARTHRQRVLHSLPLLVGGEWMISRFTVLGA